MPLYVLPQSIPQSSSEGAFTKQAKRCTSLQNGRDGVPREFIAPSIVGLDRDGRATSTIAARFLRGSATRSGSSLQLSSFRTMEGVCSQWLPSHGQYGSSDLRCRLQANALIELQFGASGKRSYCYSRSLITTFRERDSIATLSSAILVPLGGWNANIQRIRSHGRTESQTSLLRPKRLR